MMDLRTCVLQLARYAGEAANFAEKLDHADEERRGQELALEFLRQRILGGDIHHTLGELRDNLEALTRAVDADEPFYSNGDLKPDWVSQVCPERGCQSFRRVTDAFPEACPDCGEAMYIEVDDAAW